MVVIDRCYRGYRVRPSFVRLLRRNNLVGIRARNDRRCLLISRLPSIRHCDEVCCSLSVGVRNVSTVRRLLREVRRVGHRVSSLHGRLALCHGQRVRSAS